MNYEESMEQRNQQVTERYHLALDRIREIAIGESTAMPPAYQTFFRRSAIFLMRCHTFSELMTDGSMHTESYENLSLRFHELYEETLPEQYVCSYLNPDYAVEELGEECGAFFSFLYKELYSNSRHIFDQKLSMTTIYYELFLEIYGMYCSGEVRPKQLKETIYWFLYDYAEEFSEDYVEEALSTGIRYISESLMEEDLTDPRSLFRHGVLIDDKALSLHRSYACMSEQELEAYACPYVDTYMQELADRITEPGRKRVILSYPVGYDRPIHAMMMEFQKRGMEVILYPVPEEEEDSWDHSRRTMETSCRNPRYDYDHREDMALFLDKRLLDRKNDCLRKCIKEAQEDSERISGFLSFSLPKGERSPMIRKKSACHFTDRQKKMIEEYDIMNRRCIWDLTVDDGTEKMIRERRFL